MHIVLSIRCTSCPPLSPDDRSSRSPTRLSDPTFPVGICSKISIWNVSVLYFHSAPVPPGLGASAGWKHTIIMVQTGPGDRIHQVGECPDYCLMAPEPDPYGAFPRWLLHKSSRQLFSTRMKKLGHSASPVVIDGEH